MVEKEVEECMKYILKKVQKREINRRYCAKHKEKISIKNKMRYKKDPDKFRKMGQVWRDNNRDKKRAMDKKYSRSDKGLVCSKKKKKKHYEKYKDNILLKMKNYRNTEEGKIKNKESQNKYYYKNQDKILEYKKECYEKDMLTIEGRRKWDLYKMYSKIRQRAKKGLLGITWRHIEGFGRVYPPIIADETWRWDGVTRKN
jgi:hypothetical protein